MTIHGIVLIIFILFSLIHLACEAVRFKAGRYLTKPILLPALALYYVTSAVQPNVLLVAALTCSWLGDVFIMMPDPHNTHRYFKPAVTAALLGHILYVAVFAVYLPRAAGVPAWGWGILAVFIAAGAVGYRLIVPHTGRMVRLAAAYSIISILMAACTVLPLGSVATCGAVMVMAGAFVFMVSDALNAYNRFVGRVPFERVVTMCTYLAGQFLLVQGYLLF